MDHFKVLKNSLKLFCAFQIELEFWSVGFLRRGENRSTCGGKPLGARERTNNKLNPRMASMPRFDPGPHWWEACALTNAPPLLPNSYIFTVSHRLASDLISDSWSLKFPFQGQLRNLSGYFLHALLMIDIKFTMFDFVTVYCILKAWRFTWKDCDGNHGYVKFHVFVAWIADKFMILFYMYTVSFLTLL